MEQNVRKFEIRQVFSLARLDPKALLQLRETGQCTFEINEEALDVEYPGFFDRRMVAVLLTVPCVTGPNILVPCILRLLKNSIRISTDDGNDGYPHNADTDGSPIADSRFLENMVPVSAMATSRAQNDSGVLEFNFRDERYLPFEGAGAISTWSLELFHDKSNPDFGKPFRGFDYSTITDALVEMIYRGREGSELFKKGAIDHLRDYFSGDGATPSFRMFNLRQEFPTQWYRFLNPANAADGNMFEMDMSTDLFYYRDHDKTLKVNGIALFARCKKDGDYTIVLTPPAPVPATPFTLKRSNDLPELHIAATPEDADPGIEIVSDELPAKWQLKMTGPVPGNLGADPREVVDLFMILGYDWAEV